MTALLMPTNRTAVRNEILARLLQFITAIANEIDDRIRCHDFLACWRYRWRNSMFHFERQHINQLTSFTSNLRKAASTDGK